MFLSLPTQDAFSNRLPSSFLTQESGDVVVDLISVSCVVKLQVDVRAEIILSAEHLKTLDEDRHAPKDMQLFYLYSKRMESSRCYKLKEHHNATY